jgi:chromosome segregation ATPase
MTDDERASLRDALDAIEARHDAIEARLAELEQLVMVHGHELRELRAEVDRLTGERNE